MVTPTGVALHNPTVILNSIQDPELGTTEQMPDILVAWSRGFRVKHGMTGCDMVTPTYLPFREYNSVQIV